VVCGDLIIVIIIMVLILFVFNPGDLYYLGLKKIIIIVREVSFLFKRITGAVQRFNYLLLHNKQE